VGALVQIGIVLALALAAADLASAETVIESAKKWGLLGTWAIDCSKPPSRSNGHLAYRAKQGRLVHEREFGDVREESPVLSARITASGGLELLVRFESFSQTREYLMIKGSEGRIRAFFNRDVDTDVYSIKDGKIVGSGNDTVWQHRCR
jgi:hypothetical protein